MDDRLDRLRSLLGEGAWEAPASQEEPHDETIQHVPAGDPVCYLSTDPEDDEKILSISRMLGADMDPRFSIGMLFHFYMTSSKLFD
jgi:hypothetical protein